MATIHRTTLVPSKLELLATWLPRQPWFVGPGSPELHKAGGFRLDDPAGDVGIEFMFVNATAPSSSVTYHVPMTYRAAPLPAAESSLIGVAVHGVLGDRWIYDGEDDPVLLTALTRLLLGKAIPQQQSRSDEADETVLVRPASSADVAASARIVRVLGRGGAGDAAGVEATWTVPDGTAVAGRVVATVN